MRFARPALLFVSLWISVVAVPAHAGDAASCTSILAMPVENAGTVEAAFSDAWIDLLQQALAGDEGRLRGWAWSVLEMSGRTPIVSRDSWIPPAELLPAGAGDGFEGFRETWDAMALAGREVDSSRFSWSAREALRRLLGEAEAAADSRGAAEVRRSKALEPIRRVRLPSRTTGITQRVLRTRDSTLVVGSYAKEVVFMDMEGVVLNQVAIDGFYQTPLIQLRDGRIPVQVRSGELHFFSARGDALPGAIDTGSRTGLGAVTELSDGTLVVADADGRVHLLHPDGNRDFFQRSQLFKGQFLELANGEVMGASRSGEVIVFDSCGQQVRVVAQGDRLDHGPTRLWDGKVVVVDHRGRGFLISPQGDLLKEFKVAQDPGRPVALPDGGFAIRGALEGRLRYFFSSQGGRRKSPPSGADAFLISWFDPGVLSDGTLVFDDNDPSSPGLVFVKFTEGGVTHWTLPIGTKRVQWNAIEIAPGRLVVGVNDGELLFIDLEASQAAL